jgi:streptogramin lyase
VKLGRIAAVVATALIALAFASSAGAVTITEFPSNPGKESLPEKIITGPGGNLWWTERGSEPGIGRMTPTGELFSVIPSSVRPVDLVAAPSGWVSWVGEIGVGSRSPAGFATSYPSEFIGGAITLTTGGAVRMGGNTNSTAWTLLTSTSASSDHAEFGEAAEFINSRSGGKIQALAASAPNTLWASLSRTDKVLILSAAPLDEQLSVDLPANSNPQGIAIGPEGDAWVAMYDADAIDRIAPDGARTRFPLPAGSEPYDLVLGPDGAFWILEQGNAKIGRMTTAGVVTNEYAVPSGETGQSGITVGPEGNIWFTDTEMGEIGRLIPDPIVSGGGGSGSGAGGGANNTAPPPPNAHTTAPSFTIGPAFAPARFRVAVKTPKKAAGGAPVGSKIKFSLSETAAVTMTLTVKAPGRLSGKKCVAPSKAKPGATKCDRQLAKGNLPLDAKAGANQFAFSGKLAGKHLAPGSYQATFVARGAAGNSSPPATAHFTIVP